MAAVSEGKDVVVCRCEDVLLSEIRRLVGEGVWRLEEIKRLTRAGMGLCQGRTCRHLLLQEVSRLTGVPVEVLVVPKFRPPSRPVKLGVVARAAGDDAASGACADAAGVCPDGAPACPDAGAGPGAAGGYGGGGGG
ncbi:MAG: (2Fe-2S)-binding protein [Bacillota bacterium]